MAGALKRWFGEDYVQPQKRYMVGGGVYQSRTYASRPVYGYGGRFRRSTRSGRFRKSGYYGRYSRGSQVSRIRRGLNIEKKFFDTTISFLTDATGEVPATGQVTLIPQGVTESTRVGRVCTLKSLHLKFTARYLPAADTIGSAVAWIYVILDKQANGAAAASADIFTSTAGAGAMINMANSSRFKILRKFVCQFNSGAGASGAYAQDNQPYEWYKKVNIPIEYSSTTGAIGEIKSNNVFLYAGQDGNTGDDTISVNGTFRLRFTDI